ncbi:MAG: GNVR domain-containing protein [Gammaproteobacteria bacterium]|nr:GNVR domain-containing protein [Gammaproteobacteria bacterium]
MEEPEGPEGGRDAEMAGVPGYFVRESVARDSARFGSWDVFGALRREWPWVAGAVVACVAAALLFGALATPQYRAEVILAPAADDRTAGLPAITSQLGGLATLAGVDLPTNSDRTIVGLATLRSQGFARRYIEQSNLIPILFDEGPGPIGRLLGYTEPTIDDAVREFQRNVLFVGVDNRTGIIRLMVQWKDPDLAAEWANALIKQLNNEMRRQAITEARKSINYLQTELDKTNIVDVQQSIYGLIENQTKIAMVASVRDHYAFRVVDDARPPDRPVSPQRVLLFALGIVLGAALGWGLALWRDRHVRNVV